MASGSSQNEPRRPSPPPYEPPPRRSGGRERQSIGEAMTKSFIRSIASSLGRVIVRMLTGRAR